MLGMHTSSLKRDMELEIRFDKYLKNSLMRIQFPRLILELPTLKKILNANVFTLNEHWLNLAKKLMMKTFSSTLLGLKQSKKNLIELESCINSESIIVKTVIN